MGDEVSAYRPDVAIPPGETLKESIEALGITQADLARRMGRPTKTINEIINAKAMITPETALQLELVLGVPAAFWNNLENNYQLTKARLTEDERLRGEVRFLEHFPYAELVKQGCVSATRNPVQRVHELLKFFGLNSLEAIDLPSGALRVAVRSQPSPQALAAWLRIGELAARQIETQPFDAAVLTALIPQFRALTMSKSEDWSKQLQGLCAGAGVALVYVPHLPKTYAHGATRWASPARAIMLLSIRYRFADIFWFTFFHELGHILKHGKREMFVDLEGRSTSAKEAEADAFAASVLIPEMSYAEFTRGRRMSAEAVRRFAASIGIHPGIVVGRLQRDRFVDPSALNDLRDRLRWSW